MAAEQAQCPAMRTVGRVVIAVLAASVVLVGALIVIGALGIHGVVMAPAL